METASKTAFPLLMRCQAFGIYFNQNNTLQPCATGAIMRIQLPFSKPDIQEICKNVKQMALVHNSFVWKISLFFIMLLH